MLAAASHHPTGCSAAPRRGLLRRGETLEVALQKALNTLFRQIAFMLIIAQLVRLEQKTIMLKVFPLSHFFLFYNHRTFQDRNYLCHHHK